MEIVSRDQLLTSLKSLTYNKGKQGLVGERGNVPLTPWCLELKKVWP